MPKKSKNQNLRRRRRVATEDRPSSRRIGISSPSEACLPTDLGLSGHLFGDTNISGSSTVQQGDSYINVGQQSYVAAPSTVHGNMNVTVSHIHHPQLNHGNDTPIATEVKLKKILYYQAMEQRKAQLAATTPASFDWVWTDTGLVSWLQNGQGIFWIVGKPASGKSTLLHYLSNDRQGSDLVRHHLSKSWKDPLLLHFFFDFRAGAGIANTSVGMLRSFLLQLVEMNHAIKSHVIAQTGYRLDGSWPQLESELLDLVSDAINITKVPVCAFIDGLDEYSGNLRNLANTIMRLDSRSCIKLCLASREELQLSCKLPEYAFRMQDHNYDTIRAYVSDSYSCIPFQFQSVRLEEVFGRIPSGANGVILWACFAADEVSDAVLEGHGPIEAQHRLEQFPPDLQDVYHRIWQRLGQKQQKAAAAILSIIIDWDTDNLLGPTTPSIDTVWLCSMLLLKLTGEPLDASWYDDNTKFASTLQTLLRGLVEVTGSKVSLLHKTLDRFIKTSPDIAALMECFAKSIESKSLSAWFWAVYHLAKSSESDHGTCPASVISAVLILRSHRQMTGTVDLKDLEDLSDLSRHSWATSGYLPHPTNLSDSAYLQLFLAATRSSSFRDRLRKSFSTDRFSPFRDRLRTVCYTDTPPSTHSLEPPDTLFGMPELLWYMSNGYETAQIARMRDIEDELCDAARDTLFAIELESLRYRWFPSRELPPLYTDKPVHIFRSLSRAGSTIGWSHYMIETPQRLGYIMSLLELQKWKAYFLVACSIPSDSNLFSKVYAIMLSSDGIEDSFLRPSRWWLSDTLHVALCFAWSSAYARCPTTQTRRFLALRSSGMDLREPIYDGGNIMDAIFVPELAAWQLPYPLYYETDWDMTLPPYSFSKAKFCALLETESMTFGGSTSIKRHLNSARTLSDMYKKRSSHLLEFLDARICHYFMDNESHVLGMIPAAPQDPTKDASPSDLVFQQWCQVLGIASAGSDYWSDEPNYWIAFEYLAALHDLCCHVIPFLQMHLRSEVLPSRTFQDLECNACLPYKNSLPVNSCSWSIEPGWTRIRLHHPCPEP